MTYSRIAAFTAASLLLTALPAAILPAYAATTTSELSVSSQVSPAFVDDAARPSDTVAVTTNGTLLITTIGADFTNPRIEYQPLNANARFVIPIDQTLGTLQAQPGEQYQKLFLTNEGAGIDRVWWTQKAENGQISYLSVTVNNSGVLGTPIGFYSHDPSGPKLVGVSSSTVAWWFENKTLYRGTPARTELEEVASTGTSTTLPEFAVNTSGIAFLYTQAANGAGYTGRVSYVKTTSPADLNEDAFAIGTSKTKKHIDTISASPSTVTWVEASPSVGTPSLVHTVFVSDSRKVSRVFAGQPANSRVVHVPAAVGDGHVLSSSGTSANASSEFGPGGGPLLATDLNTGVVTTVASLSYGSLSAIGDGRFVAYTPTNLLTPTVSLGTPSAISTLATLPYRPAVVDGLAPVGSKVATVKLAKPASGNSTRTVVWRDRGSLVKVNAPATADTAPVVADDQARDRGQIVAPDRSKAGNVVVTTKDALLPEIASVSQTTKATLAKAPSVLSKLAVTGAGTGFVLWRSQHLSNPSVLQTTATSGGTSSIIDNIATEAVSGAVRYTVNKGSLGKVNRQNMITGQLDVIDVDAGCTPLDMQAAGKFIMYTCGNDVKVASVVPVGNAFTVTARLLPSNVSWRLGDGFAVSRSETDINVASLNDLDNIETITALTGQRMYEAHPLPVLFGADHSGPARFYVVDRDFNTHLFSVNGVNASVDGLTVSSLQTPSSVNTSTSSWNVSVNTSLASTAALTIRPALGGEPLAVLSKLTPASSHVFAWDGRSNGNFVPAGTYSWSLDAASADGLSSAHVSGTVTVTRTVSPPAPPKVTPSPSSTKVSATRWAKKKTRKINVTVRFSSQKPSSATVVAKRKSGKKWVTVSSKKVYGPAFSTKLNAKAKTTYKVCVTQTSASLASCSAAVNTR